MLVPCNPDGPLLRIYPNEKNQNDALGWRGVWNGAPSRRQAVLALSGSINHALGAESP